MHIIRSILKEISQAVGWDWAGGEGREVCEMISQDYECLGSGQVLGRGEDAELLVKRPESLPLLAH